MSNKNNQPCEPNVSLVATPEFIHIHAFEISVTASETEYADVVTYVGQKRKKLLARGIEVKPTPTTKNLYAVTMKVNPKRLANLDASIQYEDDPKRTCKQLKDLFKNTPLEFVLNEGQLSTVTVGWDITCNPERAFKDWLYCMKKLPHPFQTHRPLKMQLPDNVIQRYVLLYNNTYRLAIYDEIGREAFKDNETLFDPLPE